MGELDLGSFFCRFGGCPDARHEASSSRCRPGLPEQTHPPAKAQQKRGGENVRAARTCRRWPGRSRNSEDNIARSRKLESRSDRFESLERWDIARLED